MRIQVNRLHHPVTALGPGVRAGIWLQGCSIGCQGCLSQDTWERRPELETSVAALLEWVGALDGALDGVTISGGEPFDQPAALTALLAGLAVWRDGAEGTPDVLCYSGYSLDRLRRTDPEALAQIDAIVVGPYVRRRPTEFVWRGSANQELVPLSPLGRERYAPYVDLRVSRPSFQFAVEADAIRCIGIPRAGDMALLEASLGRAGVEMGRASWRP